MKTYYAKNPKRETKLTTLQSFTPFQLPPQIGFKFRRDIKNRVKVQSDK